MSSIGRLIVSEGFFDPPASHKGTKPYRADIYMSLLDAVVFQRASSWECALGVANQ